MEKRFDPMAMIWFRTARRKKIANCSTKRTACTGEGTRTFAGKPAAKRTFTKPYIIMKKE
jgi:hypothetical protein